MISRLPVVLVALCTLASSPCFAAGPVTTPVMIQDLPNAPGMRLTAVRVTYGPGESSRAHRHGGFLIAYVLKGAVVSQVEGEPERTYRTGESWSEDPGAHHLVARNASATEPAEFLVVFVAAKDAVLSTSDK